MPGHRVPDDELEAVIDAMPPAFTVLEFADELARHYPDRWEALIARYGLYGSGTRYSALTYLGNRLSSYSRRKVPTKLVSMPVGWAPVEGPHLRRATPHERSRFGSAWIALYRRRC